MSVIVSFKVLQKRTPGQRLERFSNLSRFLRQRFIGFDVNSGDVADNDVGLVLLHHQRRIFFDTLLLPLLSRVQGFQVLDGELHDGPSVLGEHLGVVVL